MEGVSYPRITNIVVKFTLKFDIHLDFLKFVFSNVDYRPERFNGAIVKDFGCCLLVFRNGKVNVVGAKSEGQADAAVKQFCASIDEPFDYSERQIVNIVAVSNAGRVINLLKLVQNDPVNFTYYPELYPAAYYKHFNSKVSIFHTGKLVFTGFKDKNEIDIVFMKIISLLNKNN